MAKHELPAELQWEAGHASELALSAYADGEEAMLAREVAQHLTSCNECVVRLGEMALVARGVTHAVQSVKPWLPAEMRAPQAKKRSAQPVPWAAIVAALAMTALGATPTLVALPHRLAVLTISLVKAAPVMSHSGLQVVQQGLGGAWVSAMGVSAALLVACGIALTRLLPRPVTP